MGLRARLLLLVLVPTVPALLLALYTNLQQRRYATAKVAKDAFELAQVLAASQNGLLETARGNLKAISRFPEAYGTKYTTFERFFSNICKIYPDYNDFGISETNGALISSAVGLRAQTNVADRLDFKRTLKTRDLAVGEYQPADGVLKARLPVGFPLFDDKGRAVRVVYASLDLAALNRTLGQATLPAGAVAEVFDTSGHILARSVAAEKWVGNSCAGSALFSRIQAQTNGVAEVNGLDRTKRLYGFTSLNGGEGPHLYVAVGIPASMAYSETKRMLVFNLSVLGAVATVALLAAWFYADRNILRPIRALLGTTRRVGAGDLGARTGLAAAPAEFQQLGLAFDEMAGNLQEKRKAMEDAQEEIRRLNAGLEGRVAERTAQLADANRQLESFSYSVSHDLRAPLRHINAFVGLLEEESGSSFTDQGRHFLGNISGAVTRMNALVEDLLAFARMSREEIKREPVKMGELVSEVKGEMTRDVDGREIHWKMDSLPEVVVDRAMFKQVWTNLLSNAVKYTREKTPAEITVGCREQGADYEFFVKDNGAGFDMKYADKLFGVFQRLHPPERFEGTGVGLANVQRIVARHGGRTWAESQVELGATFYFSLPRVVGK